MEIFRIGFLVVAFPVSDGRTPGAVARKISVFDLIKRLTMFRVSFEYQMKRETQVQCFDCDRTFSGDDIRQFDPKTPSPAIDWAEEVKHLAR